MGLSFRVVLDLRPWVGKKAPKRSEEFYVLRFFFFCMGGGGWVGVWGLGVWGVCGLWVSGFRVWGFRVSGLGFPAQNGAGGGLEVSDAGLRTM